MENLLSILAHSRLADDKSNGGVFLVTWLATRGLVLLKPSGVGGEGVICVLLDGVVLE